MTRRLTQQELAAQATILVELLGTLPGADTETAAGILAAEAAIRRLHRQIEDLAAGAPDLLVAVDARIQEAQDHARYWRGQAHAMRIVGAYDSAGLADARHALYGAAAADLQQLRGLLTEDES